MRQLIIGANSKIYRSRHFNFSSYDITEKEEGRGGTVSSCNILSISLCNTQLRDNLLHQRGEKYSLLFFRQRNFSDVTLADYTALCSIPFMHPFFRYYCESYMFARARARVRAECLLFRDASFIKNSLYFSTDYILAPGRVETGAKVKFTSSRAVNFPSHLKRRERSSVWKSSRGGDPRLSEQLSARGKVYAINLLHGGQ